MIWKVESYVYVDAFLLDQPECNLFMYSVAAKKRFSRKCAGVARHSFFLPLLN